jgi:gamma-glutamyltranspeptidase / glutathione hydrolase
MQSRKLRKYLQVFGKSCLPISLLPVLDILISGSIYHPLIYVYQGLSWLACRTSPVSDCPMIKTADASSPVFGKQGMVVSSNRNATEVGIQILKAGGNAVDAAVGVGYALAVVDPCCGSLGGGGFMLIRLADGKSQLINFREKAPLAATAQMYLDQQGKVISGLSTQGNLAVAVPGTVMGLNQALGQYGRLSRQQVIAPAIQLAEAGFVLNPAEVRILKQGTRKFKSQPNVAKIFLKDGRPYQAGDRLVQKDLANSLSLIASQGEKAFYQGAIASAIVKASKRNGGILSAADFRSYSVSKLDPLRCSYRGYEVLTTPPPGGGVTVCQMLNVLEGYPIKKWGWGTAPTLHVMLSSMLFAYRDRNAYLGDPDFVKNQVERLISKEYATQIRSQIMPDKAIPPEQITQTTNNHEGANTTHYSVQDRDGNAVAVTYTINSFFGAGVIAEHTGFFLNNEMDDFTIKPGSANQFKLLQGQANAIAPGKRPLSSMSPTIVSKHQRVALVTGSPGGSTIPTTVLQVITNLIDHDMPIAAAVNAPRVHYQGIPNLVLTEPYGISQPVFLSLWEMGYRVAPFYPWGAAESISVNSQTRSLTGGRDDRKPAGKALTF